MKISVAIATFNGERFLKAQLKSILDQERLPDEVVVSDDNSTDKTFDILLEFQNSTTIKTILLRNAGAPGYTQNFATALACTSGDIVFLSDQDDVWKKSKIKNIAELAAELPSHLAFLNDAELADANLIPAGLTKLGQIKAAGIAREEFVMGCCAAVRRELLDYCLPIPPDFKGHDNWLIGISNGLNATAITDDVLQYYRRHETNASMLAVNNLKRISPIPALLNSLFRVLRNRGDSDLVEVKARAQIFLDRAKILKDESVSRKQEFAKFEIDLSRKINQIDVRLRIRNASLIRRVSLLCTIENRLPYFGKSAVKKITRDLLG